MEISDYVSEKDEDIKIDWEKLAELKMEIYLRENNPKKFDRFFLKVLDYLIEKDLASWEPKKGFHTLTEARIRIDPGANAINHYLKREEDAREHIKNIFMEILNIQLQYQRLFNQQTPL